MAEQGDATHSREISELLGAIRHGDRGAWDRVAPLIYNHLHTLARGQLRRQLPGATLTPTVLVHEAYLKLAQQADPQWKNRQHFLAIAATAMRHIIVDYARRKRSQKRGGGVHHTLIEGSKLGIDSNTLDILALDQALEKLSGLDPRLTRTVELRFFGGLTVEETASVLGVSPRTVKSDWRKARALLYSALKGAAE